MPKKKKNNILIKIVFAVIVLSMVAFLLFNQSGILKYMRLKGKYNNLVNEKEKVQNKIYKMKLTIDSLKSSSVKKEQVARERYDMLNKNEKAFVFKKEK